MNTTKNLKVVQQGEPQRYGGAGETQKARADVIRDIIKVQAGLFIERPTERVSLKDTDLLIERTNEYIDVCLYHGILPNFSAIACICGISRNALYDYLRRNPDTPTGIFLEKIRTLFTSTRQAAIDRGVAAETQGIFLMKNSFQGYQDRIELSAVAENNPMADLDPEAARKRILEGIAFDGED